MGCDDNLLEGLYSVYPCIILLAKRSVFLFRYRISESCMYVDSIGCIQVDCLKFVSQHDACIFIVRINLWSLNTATRNG
jgi:hypothetical protein